MDALLMEYKSKYEFMVHFIYHEYLASISTFEGLVSMSVQNKDPMLEYYQSELQKLRSRVKEVESRFILLEDFRS